MMADKRYRIAVAHYRTTSDAVLHILGEPRQPVLPALS
jgi:hypothetical protein